MENPGRLVERLQKEGLRTLAFFQHLAPNDWEVKIYSDGSQWTARQVLAHFVSAEEAAVQLILNILAGGDGAAVDFDIELFNEREVAEKLHFTPAELLEQFGQARQASVSLVNALSTQDLQRAGRHPFLGWTTLEEIIKLLYRHNQIHQRDIRRTVLGYPARTG